MRALVKNDASIDIPALPGISIVDLFAPGIEAQQQSEVFEQLSVIHRRYFPESEHVIDEWRQQLLTGIAPTNEIVHPWLVLHNGKPAGEWIVTVNLDAGVMLMLFGAVDAEVRRQYSRSWLRDFLDFLVEYCVREARALGNSIDVVMLESEKPLEQRWVACGFELVDVNYRVPVLGMHWMKDSEIDFLDNHFAFIKKIETQGDSSMSKCVTKAIRAFALDHYGLPEALPEVQTMLTLASAMD